MANLVTSPWNLSRAWIVIAAIGGLRSHTCRKYVVVLYHPPLNFRGVLCLIRPASIAQLILLGGTEKNS